MDFATTLHNETDYDENIVVSTLHVGEERNDYVLPDCRPHMTEFNHVPNLPASSLFVSNRRNYNFCYMV